MFKNRLKEHVCNTVSNKKMATSYGIYGIRGFVYNPNNPINVWDDMEYTCKKCSKHWVGTNTCFECVPNAINLLLPTEEFLKVNNCEHLITKSLRNVWESKKRLNGIPANPRCSVHQIMNHVKRPSVNRLALNFEQLAM